MASDRIFLDTAFVQALLGKRDQFHELARALLPRIRAADEVWTTEAVLVEIGNALSSRARDDAARFIRFARETPNFRVLTVDQRLFECGLELFETRPDKTWGFTDCISFVVMEEQNLLDAATTDRHFVQAGFRALLLD